ncbi:MAG: Amidohydrolase [Nocardioides sp.]|nr:Amidohydrolase [Nocardioides sp.]
MADPTAVDVHQHVWPEELLDRLRARTRPPYLRGWTLHTHGEPAYEVDPAHHDVRRRIDADLESEVALACVSLSAPLGIEHLPRAVAAPLIAAWHEGARRLPDHFAAWALVPVVEPDLDGLAALLAEGFVGLQLPATQLLCPAAWERVGGVLRVAEAAGAPVFVHPGPATGDPTAGPVPDWWAPVVAYASQMQAAWWAWHAVGGRSLFPSLRVVFGAGAGLAPVHHERHATRGGDPLTVDPDVFVDTSSYGPQALDALVRALGIDALVLGSDRPYGAPLERLFGDAATHAVHVTNPRRLLGVDAVPDRPAVDHRVEEDQPWPQAI